MSQDDLDLTLYPKKTAHIIGVTMGVLFSAGAAAMANTEGVRLLYLFAGLFLLMTLAEIVELLPSCSYLHLDTEGFTICSFFKRTCIPWSAVDRFFALTDRGAVGMNFVPSYENPVLKNKVLRTILNCDFALPSQYGLKPEELAALMNKFLQKSQQKQF